MNSTLGSVVPLAMFVFVFALLRSSNFSVPDVFVKYFYLYFHFSEVTTFQAVLDVFVKYLYLYLNFSEVPTFQAVLDVFVKYLYLYLRFSEVPTFQVVPDVFVKYLYFEFKPFHTAEAQKV